MEKVIIDTFKKVPHLCWPSSSWSGEELSDCDAATEKKDKLRIMKVNILNIYLDVLKHCEARNITERGGKQDGVSSRRCHCCVREERRAEGGGELMFVRTDRLYLPEGHSGPLCCDHVWQRFQVIAR